MAADATLGTSIVVASQHIACAQAIGDDIHWADSVAARQHANARQILAPLARVLAKYLSTRGGNAVHVELANIVRHRSDVYLCIVVFVDPSDTIYHDMLKDMRELIRQTAAVLVQLQESSIPADVAIEPGATIKKAGDRLILAPQCVADAATLLREVAASAKGRQIDAAITLAPGDVVRISCADPSTSYLDDASLSSDVYVDSVRNSDSTVWAVFRGKPQKCNRSSLRLFFGDEDVRYALLEAQRLLTTVSIRWRPKIQKMNGASEIVGGEVLGVGPGSQKPLDFGRLEPNPPTDGPHA